MMAASTAATARGAAQLKAQGEDVWRTRVEKINAELFTLTYGALVAQLVKDSDRDYADVNKQLEKMGYNIGVRLIEDFLARSNARRCADLRETAEVISKVGFKMFLNITPAVTNWSPDGKAFSLLFEDNPLTDFVELPEDAAGLSYCNLLCGVLRGALEMVQMQVECSFVKDVLRDGEPSELRVKLIKILEDEIPVGED
eukprot:Unigene2450_Nuclearia_a/m.7561 Unigene2450_Nuclearia_a/g.7561  ORF Unigene2450_Nuclearia_a/g.7561 Unigene2450_Nuclearia_a/m.7561 type:complete len:199 (-) Unigene2450_Nuclearia_a:9-605(-)